MKFFYQVILFLLFLVFQLFLENTVQHLLGDNTIRFSFSIIFLVNLFVFIFYGNFRLFLFLQMLSVVIYALVLIPHFYFFNIFSFYSRINYLFLNPREFVIGFVYAVIELVILYFFCKIQFSFVKNIQYKKFIIGIFIALLLLCRLIFSDKDATMFSQRTIFTFINLNECLIIKEEYSKFKNGSTRIVDYECSEHQNKSPSISSLMNDTDKRDLLLIVESWSELNNENNQQLCVDYLKNLFNKHNHLKKSYNIFFEHSCFHGNTAAAEGRELLNMNDEESYSSFLNKSALPKYNLVTYKLNNRYRTISGFSASKEYGSNRSNAEGFRKKLGFNSRFYFEELIKNKNSKLNKESPYKAVFDETMIDSLFNESKRYEKVFAYGLTINTHSPFNLSMDDVNKQLYDEANKLMFNAFDDNKYAFNQFFRISEILNHTFKQMDDDTTVFDKILIIGDHAYPDLRCKNLYNKEEVPYILLQRK